MKTVNEHVVDFATVALSDLIAEIEKCKHAIYGKDYYMSIMRYIESVPEVYGRFDINDNRYLVVCIYLLENFDCVIDYYLDAQHIIGGETLDIHFPSDAEYIRFTLMFNKENV